MKTQTTLIIVALMFVFSCTQNQEQTTRSPEVVQANGYVIPRDSIRIGVLPSVKFEVIQAGKPVIVPGDSNVQRAGIPKVVIADNSKVFTPGEDSFSLPETAPAICESFTAGIPKRVVAKDAYSSEQTGQDFVSFRQHQGLNYDLITNLTEDRFGNLWISTLGGGVCKYDGNSFTHYNVKEGLSHNSILSMMEDRSGNLWFGALGAGLNKFDGKHFTTFKQGLGNNIVTSIFQDKSGSTWIGTHSDGLYKYDGRSFTHFTTRQGLISNFVLPILQDKDRNLWIGTRDGLSKYDGKSFTNFGNKEGLGQSLSIRSLFEDKYGNLWIGTLTGGVIKYDGNNFIHFTTETGLSNNNVRKILQDRNGDFWFGTHGGGVNKYDGKKFTHYTTKDGLSNDIITSMVEDCHGNIWFGTHGGGINKYIGGNLTHFSVDTGMNDNKVRCILQDKNEDLLFGTSLGGTTKYDGRNFFHITTTQGMRTLMAISMFEDKTGNLWFGDYWGITKFNGKTFTHFQPDAHFEVFSIMEDKKGNMWFGTFGSGITKYDGRTFTYYTDNDSLGNNIVTSIIEDKSGGLWIGSYGGGLYKYDGSRFIHFTNKNGLKDNFINNIHEDKSGNLWIATLNSGVIKFDGKNFTHFTENEGLSNNHVKNIMEDRAGNIWFGTGSGISRLERNKEPKLLFKNYTYEDGLLGIEVNRGKTLFEAKNGTIWIGANDRLTAFYPHKTSPDSIPPNLQLTGITLFNENISWQNLKDTGFVLGNGVRIHDFHFDSVSRWYSVPENLSLAYNNNHLAFQFVGITTQSPGKVKYQYKLEGFDQNWSAPSTRSEAPYGNLPHGKYTFRVKATNSEGYWSNELAYTFIIMPPWWRTWWAYLLYTILFTGLIYALFRYRLNKIRMKHEIAVQKHKAVELEMHALRAQMNPHFIYNSLNSINLFILENNKLQASDYLTKFSRLVRLILHNSQEDFIPLANELEALELYLKLEALRFEQRFKYNISVEKDIDSTLLKVPPLIIQPYVENAIWHGLMHKKDRGHLDIEINHEGEILFCRITDDGIGRKKALEENRKSNPNRKSIGMHITAERIAILQHKTEIDTYVTVNDIVLPDGSPGGTQVLLKIPGTYD